jgi:acetyl coenzyme A synthetase (ADP forming)-like protein
MGALSPPVAAPEQEHAARVASLRRLLHPASVAVIGASRDPESIGHRILRNLLDGGFAGDVHPINPRVSHVLERPAYPDIDAVPGPVDLAVVVTPAATVCEVARSCASRGVAGLVVITAGFAETGPEGAEREARLRDICRAAGMRLVGPNCLGLADTGSGVNATFLPHPPLPGPLGVMSQSGALGVALVERARVLGLGLSTFVSVGNKADVSGNDLLEYWEDDPATDLIAFYLESFGDPVRFADLARRVGARKPVIALKSGRSRAGDRAVRSHTAAAATPDVAVDALLRGCGVIRVESMQDLLDTARLLATQPLPRGSRVAIVGNSGGPGALAADACERAGLTVPELSTGTQRLVRDGLRAPLRPVAAVANPIDLTADGDAVDLAHAMTTVLADPAVDTLLVVYTPRSEPGDAVARLAIAEVAATTSKTVLACLVGHDGMVEASPVPAYAFPEQAARALRHAVDYARWRAGSAPAEPAGWRAEVAPPWADVERARGIIRRHLADAGPEWLDPATAADLLGCYGVNVARSVTVHSEEAAAAAAAEVGLPTALKATGPALVHKSDVGGVRLDLSTPDRVADNYRELAASLGPRMTGAVVQRMAGSGVEMIVGAVRHRAFGPLVMVGMGGVAADLLADRTFRVPPITTREAAAMVAELRCSPLLSGYRGSPVVDSASLFEQVVRVGRMVRDLPEVAELDLNPVIVTGDGAVTVDARIRLAIPTAS